MEADCDSASQEISPQFAELLRFVTYLQGPISRSCTQPDESIPLTHLFFLDPFNIILPVFSSEHIFQLSFFTFFSSFMHAVGPTPLTLIFFALIKQQRSKYDAAAFFSIDSNMS